MLFMRGVRFDGVSHSEGELRCDVGCGVGGWIGGLVHLYMRHLGSVWGGVLTRWALCCVGYEKEIVFLGKRG